MSAHYKHEKNWIAAVVTVIANGNTGVPTANIQWALSSVTAATPRVSIRVLGVSRLSAHLQKAYAQYYYDHWAVDLETEVTTRRVAASTQDHADIVARVRGLYEIDAQKFVSPALTYYQTLDILETGSARSVETDQREDTTLMTHRIQYAIPPGSMTVTLEALTDAAGVNICDASGVDFATAQL